MFRLKYPQILLLGLALNLVGTLAHASEVDTFNQRFTPLEDSLETLDRKLNTLFQESLDQANEKVGCDEKRLYKNLRKRFRNHVFDEFNKWLYYLEDIDHIDHIDTPIRESIYQGFNV